MARPPMEQIGPVINTTPFWGNFPVVGHLGPTGPCNNHYYSAIVASGRVAWILGTINAFGPFIV